MKPFTQTEYRQAYKRLSPEKRSRIGATNIRAMQVAFAETHGFTGNKQDELLDLLDAHTYELISDEELRQCLTQDLGRNETFVRSVEELIASCASVEPEFSYLTESEDEEDAIDRTPDTLSTLREITTTPPSIPHAPYQTDTTSETAQPAQAGTVSPLEQFIRKDAIVAERYAKFPEQVRATIASPVVANAFSACIRTYNISQEGFMALGALIVRLLVGLESTNDFRTHVRERAIVQPERYEEFIRVLEEGVVRPVQESIMAILASRKSGGHTP